MSTNRGASHFAIRIYLADDHPIVRHGLRQLIEGQPGMRVVGEAADGRQVLLAEGKETWDILILDLSLPRVNGIEVLRRLHAERPELRVMVLSMYPEDQYALRLLREGAVAYLSKDRAADELVQALHEVARGGRYISRGLSARTPTEERDGGKPAHASLSAREYQVFTLLFQGRTVSEIAAELNLSVSTVSNHVGRVKEKLGARSVGDIVSYAHRAGLVDPV